MRKRFLLLLVLNFLTTVDARRKSFCQKIDIGMCKDLPYNLTSMPNLVGHDEQTEAELQLATFEPLIRVQCSTRLKFFLCSLYVPMCTEKVKTPIGPCRPLCQSVRSCCEPMLNQFGFSWPAPFDCTKFPVENNAETMCMIGPGYGQLGDEKSSCDYLSPSGMDKPSASQTTTDDNRQSKNLDASQDYIKCHALLYDKSQTATAMFIMMSLAGLVFFIVLICVLLHFLSTSSTSNLPISSPNSKLIGFSAADRCLFYAIFCNGALSLAPLIQLSSKYESVSCAASDGNSRGDGKFLVSSGDGGSDLYYNTSCASISVLFYYFWTAANYWWMAACFALFYADKMGDHVTTDFRRLNFYLHLSAWISPLIQTTILLADQAVDADPLTGFCSMGNQNLKNLFKFRILPEIIYFLIGFIFLVLSECRKQKLDPQVRRSKRNFASSSSTIIVCRLYLIIALCLIVGHILQYYLRKNSRRPVYEISILEFIAQYSFGLVAGVWFSADKLSTVKLMNDKNSKRKNNNRILAPLRGKSLANTNNNSDISNQGQFYQTVI